MQPGTNKTTFPTAPGALGALPSRPSSALGTLPAPLPLLNPASPRSFRNLVLRYGFAVLIVLLALLLRLAMASRFGSGLTYITFYPAVMVVATVAGFGPGLVATILAALAATYFILPPVGQFTLASTADAIGLAVFSTMGLFMSAVAGLYRRARMQLGNFERLSALRESEARLHETQERLRLFVEHAPAAVAMLDRDMRYLAVSRRWLIDYHLPNQNVLGRGHYEVFPDVPERWKLIHQRCLAGAIEHADEDPFPRTDGTVDYVRWEIRPWHTAAGEIGGLMVFTEVVTERRRAFDLLRTRMAAIDATADMVVITDSKGTIQYVNPAFTKVTGYSAAEAMGQNPRLLKSGRHSSDFYRKLWSTIRAGRVWQGELVNRRKDGSFYPEEMTIAPVVDGDGGILNFIAIKRDITARRQAEEALRDAKADAETASQAKDRFLAMLSHELRTPLTPALLTASSLEADPHLPESFREDIVTIRRNLELETRLIDDLLDLTRISKGKLTLQPQVLDFHSKVHNAIDICRAELEAKNFNLQLHLDAMEYHISGDSGRIQQIVWNLLKNAAKFTPENGHIAIRTSNPYPGVIRVEVTDDGIGIAPDRLPHLFEAFEQGAKIAQTYGGLGLGLTICKALVELHHGTIRAASPGAGHGTTLTVELPTAPVVDPPVQPAATPASRSPLHAAARSLCILYVEDHEATARVLTRLLRGMGHEVHLAISLAQAAGLLPEHHFDLVISDLGLPDGSGLTLMQQVLAYQGPTPAIALSGYGMEDDIQQSRNAGFTEHLTKPVDVTTFRDALDRVTAAPPP